MRATLRKIVPLAVKLLLAAVVFGYLGWKASQDRSFDDLIQKEKHWPLFAAAWLAVTGMVALQAIRWGLLARALGFAVGFGESLRIGFIAHFGTQFMAGMVIGDAIRAGAIARSHRGRMTDAIACTIFDRSIGMFGLLITAAIATFLFDLSSLKGKVADSALQTLILLSWGARIGSVVGAISLGLLFVPAMLEWRLWKRFSTLPVVGKTFGELLNAAKLYHSRPGAIALALALTFGVHLLGALSIHLAAEGLPSRAARPGMAADMTVYTLTSGINALPVGAFDLVFNEMYRGVSVPEMPATQGFVIVLAWRLVGAAVAVIGLSLFLLGRKRGEEKIAVRPEANG